MPEPCRLPSVLFVTIALYNRGVHCLRRQVRPFARLNARIKLQVPGTARAAMRFHEETLRCELLC